MDFREGKPKGTYQTAEMAAPEAIELSTEWVWDIEGSPKVMQLCEEGLTMASAIIKDRDAMRFVD